MTVRPDWSELEADQGRGLIRRRMLPDSGHDLFLAVRHPSRQRMLTLRLDIATSRRIGRSLQLAPATEGIDLSLSEGSSPELQLKLRAPTLAGVFDVLVDDVAGMASATATTAAAASAVVERYNHWLRLLRSLDVEGLSLQARRGLFGELYTMQRLLGHGVAGDTATRAWTGPTGGNQDFQFSGVAIEVKTSAGRDPQHLTIASERQLDPGACETLLLGHLVIDERQGGSGVSLNAIVGAVRGALESTSAAGEFDALLIRAGFLPHQFDLYDEPRYEIRRESVWRVAGSFPRILEQDLRPGVGSCTYQVSTSGLDNYLVTEEQFSLLVTEGSRR